MENRKCFYLVEGECEEKLLKALKGQPALIAPGCFGIYTVRKSLFLQKNNWLISSFFIVSSPPESPCLQFYPYGV